MPDLVTMQLDAAAALAAELTALGAELAADGDDTAAGGTRLTAALSGPVAEELGAAGSGWVGLMAALSDRAQVVAVTLTECVASYRLLDEMVTERMGAGLNAPTAR